MNKKSFKAILSEKKGASLIFVLAITLMLLAIGASVLTAASTSAGATKSKLSHDRLDLYSNSVVKAIAYSLQEEDPVTPQSTLGNQLLLALYQNADSAIIPTPALPVSLEMSFDSAIAGIPPTQELSLSYPERQIVINEAIPETPALVVDGVVLSPAVPAQPKTASINAEVTFTIEAEIDGIKSKTVATFQLRNASIENDIIVSSGDWRLTYHEKI